MRILVASAEAVPFFKTGGLADVSRALPDALAELGHDVRVVMPGYSFLHDRIAGLPVDAELAVASGGRPVRFDVALYSPDRGAATAFILVPGVFDTAEPYEPVPEDPLALGERFAFFSRAVVAYAEHWDADVVHLNEWQTGLVPVFAATDGMRAATFFSIHNLAYQGNFPRGLLNRSGVPTAFFRTENGVEFHGAASFIKAGIALADRLGTVSSAYAREIQTPEFGAGLDGLLRSRRRLLHGVLNGIDTDVWNPMTDPLLPARYNVRTLKRKDESRRALLAMAECGGAGAVLGIVSRLAHQKGIDILIQAVPGLVQRGCTLVVLGSGEGHHEGELDDLARTWPRQVAFARGFNDPLAHLIYAGSDFFLMPSRYEPCGLGQMIAQRYGTPPIARRTGGLSDTIADGETGFLFDDATPESLLGAIDRALGYWNQRGWRALQGRCMRQDHSWSRSAREYARLFEMAMGSAAPPLDSTPRFR